MCLCTPVTLLLHSAARPSRHLKCHLSQGSGSGLRLTGPDRLLAQLDAQLAKPTTRQPNAPQAWPLSGELACLQVGYPLQHYMKGCSIGTHTDSVNQGQLPEGFLNHTGHSLQGDRHPREHPPRTRMNVCASCRHHTAGVLAGGARLMLLSANMCSYGVSGPSAKPACSPVMTTTHNH